MLPPPCLIEIQLPTFSLCAPDPSNHRTHGPSHTRHTACGGNPAGKAPGGGGGKVRGTHSNEHSIPEPTPETYLTYMPRNQPLLSLGGEPSPQPCDSSSPNQELLTQCAHCYSSQALTNQLDRRTSAEPCLFQVVSVAAFVVGSAAQAMRRLYLTQLSDSMMGTLHSEKMADSMLDQHAARC